MEKGEQASKLQRERSPKGQGSEMADLYSVHLEKTHEKLKEETKGEKPQRPPKEWPMRLSVPGDSRTLLWYGFKCGSAVVNPAALGDGPAVWRTCIVATASWEGELPMKARSVLRPGDTFNRILGKRLALSRLVKLLIPGKGAAERKKRGKLFLALAPTPRTPRLNNHYSFTGVNGSKSGVFNSSGIACQPVTLASLSMADWDKASAAYYNRYREQRQKGGAK